MHQTRYQSQKKCPCPGVLRLHLRLLLANNHHLFSPSSFPSIRSFQFTSSIGSFSFHYPPNPEQPTHPCLYLYSCKAAKHTLTAQHSIPHDKPSPLERARVHHSVTLSKSLITTDIWARFAASATRLKSLKNGAVAVGPPAPSI